MDLLNTIIVLSIVILIHELGHFLAAKIIGVRVDEFGLGLPPKIFGEKFGETLYSLNLLPVGGFVRMYGEQEADTKPTTSPRAFFNKSKKQRAFVILAGVAMNILLAAACFSIIFSVSGIPEEVDYIVVDGITKNSPAETAGILPGDRVLAIDGISENQTDKFITYLKDHAGSQVSISLQRKEERLVKTLVPRVNPPVGEGAVGMLVSKTDFVFYPAWQMPFRGTWVGLQRTYEWTVMMISGLGTMIKEGLQGQKPQVGGVIVIHDTIARASEEGWIGILSIMGIISINLAVINVLPFPALDGGRFMFIMLEKVIGRKIRPKIEAYINMAGFMILIALMILINLSDILRKVRGG